MKANSDKSKQSNKATRRVLAGVLCGASVLSLVLSLVMPPISQAIANDGQTGSTEEAVADENTLGEEAGAGNSTGKDAKNRNSADAEGGESEDAVTEGQPSDDTKVEGDTQSADDGVNGDGAIALTAGNESPYTINSGDELSKKLLNKGLRDANGCATFKLVNDIEYNYEIRFEQTDNNPINITLNLNGHKIKHESADQSLFNITGGATLTIKDLINDSDPDSDPEKTSEKVSKVKELNNQGQNFNPDNYGKAAEFVYENGIPSGLTYYVTESSPSTADITKTTETLSKHSVDIKGAIVACNSSNRVSLIKLDGEGCTFNLQGGVLTQEENRNVGHLIYARNRSAVNMSGGYVCGASVGRDGAGAGIAVINNSTLEISDGVIAGNFAPSGGGVYAKDSAVDMVGGIISGNGTNNDQSGYGAGICAENSNVIITNGHITNNRYQHYIDEEGSTKHLGNGCHGGGGIAAWNGGSLTIVGGYITGNYSAEAGGGVYAGVWNSALSGFTFYGGTIASNVAANSEGGGIRISAPTKGVFEVPIDSHAYITNNTTNTSNDWGGGGVFVQGGNGSVQPASLRISNALITNNHAKGYGGGFAACPTGKTAITDTNGIAIFGNDDENGEKLSGGTNGKNEDQNWDETKPDSSGEITETFKTGGHKDLFLIRKRGNGDYIAAVTGQMLGGGAANWKGTIDGQSTTIGKYDGAQAKYMIGLKSEPIQEDMDAATAAASLFITGNRSNVHGGGIMTNGNVVAGSTTEVKVYPKMKLNGTKELTGRALDAGEFKFQLLKPGKGGKAPSFNDGKLQLNDCSVVDTVKNDKKGYFTFDLGEVYADDALVYYLVEVPGTDKNKGVAYDETIYKIDPTVVEDAGKSHDVLGIKYEYYKVESVSVTRVENDGAGARTPETESAAIAAAEGENAATITLTKGATFTNTYTSSGSWTPQVTKKVDGGEMKKFKFELYTEDGNGKKVLDTKWTTDDSNSSQTVKFDDQKLEVSDFNDGKATFTYYIRECPASKDDGTKHEGYTNDTKTFKVVVTAKDNGDGTLECTPAYYEVDANGTERETDNPTFTNTYSTSLPLSGMSGVTLTYLAGAAVLCAAAAWMHIRRKANAKGGERCE